MIESTLDTNIYSSRVDCMDSPDHPLLHCTRHYRRWSRWWPEVCTGPLRSQSVHVAQHTSHIELRVHWYVYTAYSGDSEVDEGGYVVLQVVQCSVGNLK